MAFPHDDITSLVLNAYYVVYNTLPRGLTEVLYQRALAIELKDFQLRVQRECAFDVWYRARNIGRYRADLVVNDLVLVETRCADRLVQAHREQLTRYLKISSLPVGLLLNFGDRAEVRRIVL